MTQGSIVLNRGVRPSGGVFGAATGSHKRPTATVATRVLMREATHRFMLVNFKGAYRVANVVAPHLYFVLHRPTNTHFSVCTHSNLLSK